MAMGIGVAGTFKASDYTDAGYTGVGLSAFNSAIGKGKQVIGQYTIPHWRGGRGGGGKQFFVVADAPQPQQQAAPAPAPAPATNPAVQQLAELTAQSEAYRKEAEAAIKAGRLQIAQMEDADLQRQKAAELQNRLAIQAQTSQARGAAQANLKIAPASQTAQTAGTQAFKRRNQMRLAPIQTTAGINAPASSVLNV